MREIALFALISSCLAGEADACICIDIAPKFPVDGSSEVPVDARIWLPLLNCIRPARFAVIDVNTAVPVDGSLIALGADSCVFTPTQLLAPQTQYAVGELEYDPALFPIPDQIANDQFFSQRVFTTGTIGTASPPSVPSVQFNELAERIGRSDCDAPGLNLAAVFDIVTDAPVVVADIDGAGRETPFDPISRFLLSDQRELRFTNSICGLPWEVPFGGTASFRFGAIDSAGVFSGWSAPIDIAVPPAPPVDEVEESNDVPDTQTEDVGSCQAASSSSIAVLAFLLATRRRYGR